MKPKFRLLRSLKILVSIYLVSHIADAQPSSKNTIKSVLHKDSLFWAAYNNCEIEGLMQYVADDVEFHHDKNGVLNGKDNFRMAFQKNLCEKKEYRLRREAVKNTVDVFSMRRGDTLYGLEIKGEHLFYVSENGKKERLEGIAKFMNLWEPKNGKWKMSRILSYDYRPAYTNSRNEIHLSKEILNTYAGKYNSLKNGIITVQPLEASLALLVAKQKFILYPEAQALFFIKERDLTVEFVKNGQNKVTKMIVRENGVIAEEAEIVK